MSLFGSLFSGVSGLNAQSRAMGMISDNVANVNTVGYKGAKADFTNMVTQSSRDAPYSPGGTKAVTSYNISKQGLIQGSDEPTHIAISGAGFFVVNSKPDGTGEELFSRDGSFSPDVQGALRTPSGFFLQGWKLDNTGAIMDQNVLATVNISGVNGIANPTTEVDIGANLDADAVTYMGAYAPGNLADGTVPPTFERTMQVYDSLGRARSLTIGFLKTGPNAWKTELYATDPADVDAVAHPSGLIADGDLTFNGDGSLASSPFAGLLTVTWDAATGATPSTIDMSVGTVGDTDGFTQFAAPNDVAFVKQNGVEVGQLTGVSINEEGFFIASFSNGQSRALYRLPVATFVNPLALAPETGNVFSRTVASGNPDLRLSGNGGAGSILPASLESANVDIAQEFTKMIVTQRAYSANARVITTTSDMLNELLQMNR